VGAKIKIPAAPAAAGAITPPSGNATKIVAAPAPEPASPVPPDRAYKVKTFAEKPNLDYAQTNLRVPCLPEDEYLTVFGQYIIKPELFDLLENNIKNNLRERGEFQLTGALDRLRQIDGFNGLVIDGQRFDIGIPDYYLKTLQAFSQA
jgi:UTP-glucose-1-phosphate uridylyltransferase